MHQKLANILLFLLVTGLSYALPSDKNEIIHVDADTADLNQLTHKGTYSGHIHFNQGTTNLHANKAITEGNEKNQLVLAVAKGSTTEQAHFWTQTAVDKPVLHAYANTIRYYAQKHLIALIGNAKVLQGENSFSAPRIYYNTLKQQVISKNNGSHQTQIVFYPEKKKI